MECFLTDCLKNVGKEPKKALRSNKDFVQFRSNWDIFMGIGERTHRVIEEKHLLNRMNRSWRWEEKRERGYIGQWDLFMGGCRRIFIWKQTYFQLHS